MQKIVHQKFCSRTAGRRLANVPRGGRSEPGGPQSLLCVRKDRVEHSQVCASVRKVSSSRKPSFPSRASVSMGTPRKVKTRLVVLLCCRCACRTPPHARGCMERHPARRDLESGAELVGHGTRISPRSGPGSQRLVRNPRLQSGPRETVPRGVGGAPTTRTPEDDGLDEALQQSKSRRKCGLWHQRSCCLSFRGMAMSQAGTRGYTTVHTVFRVVSKRTALASVGFKFVSYMGFSKEACPLLLSCPA